MADSIPSKRIVAGICAILLGTLGIHKFVLGYNREGLILLLTFVLTLGIASMATGFIVLLEGIVYLVKSDEDFVATYQENRKGWF